jgi:hypothetical protein
MEDIKDKLLADIVSDLAPSELVKTLHIATPSMCATITPSFLCDNESDGNDSVIEYAPSDCTLNGTDSEHSAYDDTVSEGGIPGVDEGWLVMKSYEHDAQPSKIENVNPFRLESWCHKIAMHTFSTRVVDLRYAEAKSLTRYFESFKRQRQLKSKTHSPPLFILFSDVLFYTVIAMLAWNIQNHYEHPLPLDELLCWIDQEVVSKLSSDDIEHIHEIEMKIEAAMNDLPQPTNGAFVRLSTRSPKDAALSSLHIRELIGEGIASHAEACPDATEAEKIDEDLNIFTIATCAALQITTAQDAVNLLLHSQCVFDDIMRCDLDMDMNADSKDPEDYWDMKLIVREWWPHLFPPFEFRCFVYHDFMTAITQYYSLTYYPEVVDNRDAIRDMILGKWNEVHPLLHMHSYTIDFAISRDMDAIMVVEINQLPPAAGTCLFRFDDPRDRSQIEKGYSDVNLGVSYGKGKVGPNASSACESSSLSHNLDARVIEGGVLNEGVGACEMMKDACTDVIQIVRSVEIRVNMEPLTNHSVPHERNALDAIDTALRLHIDQLRGRVEISLPSQQQSVDHGGADNNTSILINQKTNCVVM